MSEQWSTPSLHVGSGAAYQPPAVVDRDPITSMFQLDWLGAGEQDETGQWSATTYITRRGRVTRAPGVDATAAASPQQHTAVEGRRSLLAASGTIAVASLVSRLTGFLRSSMLVAALGIAHVGDAFNAANNFPNMVYELLLGGVLSSVLIPLLVGAQEKDEDDGIAYTQRLLSIATAALGVMTIVAVACAPLIAAGFVHDPAQRGLASTFATLLLPEIFFYGIGAMFMAVLNIRHSYGPAAWSPVLNNVVMIATIVIFWLLPGPKTLTPSTITTAQILVLGIGTTLGIASQALVLIPALRHTGFSWRWRFRARPNEVGRMKEVGTLAGWVLGYVVASQIGVTVVAKVGLDNKAFTVFTNADLLLQMPYGILVVSLLTALMPRLSRAAAQGRTSDVIDDLGLAARLSAFALVPVTAGFIVLGPVLNVVLFAYGETSIAGARAIGTALAFSAFGLFPFALVMLQLRVFYAMRDGRTPTVINAAMVTTKVVLILILARVVHGPAHIAYALTGSTSASYVVGAVVGHIVLSRRLGSLHFSPVVRTTAQSVVASAVGGVVAYGLVRVSEDLAGYGRGGSLLALVVGGLVGLAVMLAVAWRLRINELTQFRAMLSR